MNKRWLAGCGFWEVKFNPPSLWGESARLERSSWGFKALQERRVPHSRVGSPEHQAWLCWLLAADLGQDCSTSPKLFPKL